MPADIWHDPIVLLLMGAAAAIVGNLIVARLKKARGTEEIIRDMGRWVLPHFMPDENGSTHNTQPARVERLELNNEEVKTRLTAHLIEEEAGVRVTNSRLGSIEDTLKELKDR